MTTKLILKLIYKNTKYKKTDEHKLKIDTEIDRKIDRYRKIKRITAICKSR